MFTHSTNDCNVFRWQIHSAINEGRLKFAIHLEIGEHRVEQYLIVSMLNCEEKQVWIRPKHADATKGKKVAMASKISND